MCFNEATRIEPENAMYWSLKVHSLKLLERYEEALTCNDEVIKLKPTSLAWLIKSELLKKLGRTEEAEQCVTKAKELNLNKS
jgi:tetratricopeptide (TPR) repeat protein